MKDLSNAKLPMYVAMEVPEKLAAEKSPLLSTRAKSKS